MRNPIWATLGLEPTNDAAEIKRAYARRLKQVHPEDDPEGFQALREAYDQASRMARNGWAVPTPADDLDDEADESDELVAEAWSAPQVWAQPRQTEAAEGWSREPGDRWAPAEAAPASIDIPDDIRAELARERDLAASHKALCDQLAALVANPDGDRHEALSAMLRILRSPGMDSLDAYARTERWLAHLATVGGPVVDELIEPLIEFFRWNDQPVGVDLRHAYPVLRRRDLGIALRRLERKSDPNHEAWVALRDTPTPFSRLRARLSPGLEKRVPALLDAIERDLPQIVPRLNAEAAAWWRERRRQPQLSAEYLWVLLIAPLVVGSFGAVSTAFGPPSWLTFAALWTVVFSSVLGGGCAWLYGIARPRRRWLEEGLAARAPLWIQLGWAPAALLTVLLASASGGLLMGVLVIVLGGAAMIWRSIVAPARDPRILRAFLQSQIYHRVPFVCLGMFGAMTLGAAAGPLAWASGFATLTLLFGQLELQEAWLRIPTARRRMAAAGLGGVALVGACVIGLIGHAGLMAAALAVAAVCSLLALPLVALQPTLIRRSVPVLQMLGLFVAIGSVDGDMTGHLPLAANIGQWLFGVAALTGAISMLPEIPLPRLKRRRGTDKFG